MEQVAVAVNKRYFASNYIRDCLAENGEQSDFFLFMEKMAQFLLEGGAISQLVDGKRDAGNLISVLKQVCCATLRWHKPFERLSRYEISQSRDAGGLDIASMSVCTVSRKINELVKEGLLLRFRMGSGNKMLYALNVKKILEIIGKKFDGRVACCSYSQHKLSLFEELRQSPFVSFFDRIIRSFADKHVSGLLEIKRLMEGVMASLVSSVRKAKEFALGTSESKSKAKSEQPLFNPRNGNPNPAAALEYWHKCVRDTGRFGLYSGRRTGKLMGQMKNWLNEMAQNGYSEDEIRHNIKELVSKWDYVPSSERTLTVMSKNNKLYEVRLPICPEFDLFYAHRNEITQVVMRASEPNKSTDGKDLRNFTSDDMISVL